MPALACVPLSDSHYTAEYARKTFSQYPLIVDGIVTEPMEWNMLSASPATIQIKKVWKGERIPSVKIYWLSMCEELLMERGQRLSMALLKKENLRIRGLPIMYQLKFLFSGKISDFLERWRLLYTERQVYILVDSVAGNRPYDQEMRRLFKAEQRQ
ncbi:MAG: hypothetical protein U9R73_02520 [Pseudomonadota bacterium]|nr:hypothetical protein [Pseudomonadota bacterium]